MSYEQHKTLSEVAERHGYAPRMNDRLVPLAAAIIAVLAALGTLFAQHRSISALSIKTQAILSQSRALDLYNAYQAHQVKYTVYMALLNAGLVSGAPARAQLKATAASQQRNSLQLLATAKSFEAEALNDQHRSEQYLSSFEMLEVATTFFEIGIVFVSISALSETKLLLYAAGATTLLGAGFLIVGLLPAH